MPYLVATAALAVCAVLSKENTASLPAALLLAEWVGFGWPRRWRALALAAALVLAMAAVPIMWRATVWRRAERGAPSAVAQLWRPVAQYCHGLTLDPQDEVGRDNLTIALESLGEVEIDDAAAYCPELEPQMNTDEHR